MTGPHLTKRRGMTVFKYTQVRKYTHIPPDFLLQMKSWFYTQKFVIKKNHRGHGHLSGRRDGIHINFVPKFLISVKQFPDHAEVTFSYAARIRKIGIATALLTEGLSLIVASVTLSSHIAAARGFVDTVTDVMDSISGAPYEVNWVEATEVEGGQTTTTTTTVRQVAAPPAPVVVPPSPVVVKAITPKAPTPNIMDAPVIERVVEQPQPQPQIIVVPQSTIVIQAPPMGYPYGMMQGMGYQQQQPTSIQYDPSFGSNNMNNGQSALPQIAYQPANQQFSIGNPTVPTMVERPTMLTSTRYPMPTPFDQAPTSSYSTFSAPLPSSSSTTTSAPLLEIEYPMSKSSVPSISPSSFSLTEPMFQKKQEPFIAAGGPPMSYGSARN